MISRAWAQMRRAAIRGRATFFAAVDDLTALGVLLTLYVCCGVGLVLRVDMSTYKQSSYSLHVVNGSL